MSDVRALVLEAEIAIDPATDPAAVGAAVTVELCGNTDHEGPCRWPHNSAIDEAAEPALLRTVFVAGDDEADSVAGRIEAALDAADGWRLVSVRRRKPAAAERELAESLLAGPRAAGRG